MNSTPNRRHLRLLVTAAVLAFAGSGCAAGADSGAPSRTPTLSGSPATAIAEDMAFSGALTGRMTSGSAGDAYVCAAGAASFVAGPILGNVGGRQVEMDIAEVSFRGAGSYPAAGVSFDAAADHYYPATGAPGTLVVGPDLRSGTVDIALAVNSDPNRVVAHVTGTWRCPPGG